LTQVCYVCITHGSIQSVITELILYVKLFLALYSEIFASDSVTVKELCTGKWSRELYF